MTIHRIPLSIRNEFHEVGEQVHVERHAIRQALAWRVSAEFSRRHPGDILVTEMHPAGGQYDCGSSVRAPAVLRGKKPPPMTLS